MTATSSAADIARGRMVPWVIAIFFIAFILPLLGFTWIAFKYKPSEVTAHAYDKGLAYNHILKEENIQEALGWKATLTMTGTALTVHLEDKDNKPIHGAMVKAWFIRPATASMDQWAHMKETHAGYYMAMLPDPIPGLWEVRVTAKLGNEQFQAARSFSITP